MSLIWRGRFLPVRQFARWLIRLLRKYPAFLAGIALLVVWQICLLLTQEPEGPDPPSRPIAFPPSPSDPPRALGVASCAAQGCHANPKFPLNYPPLVDLGDPAADVPWQSSYFTWHNYDRHAQSYATLQNERSKHIMKGLRRDPRSAPRDPDCLACHSNPTLAGRTDEIACSLQTEGVSCESCHGNAELWRNEHVNWNSGSHRNLIIDRQYDSHKMTKLFDLRVRAETCAGCHVGSPKIGDQGKVDVPMRDVNHNLFAAGHPPLNFEFATYLRKLPRHWTEKDRLADNAKRKAGYEAQVWLYGQVAGTEAALKLLAERARVAKPDDWPQLAEFNCAACHHSLKPAGSRIASTGVMRWNQPGFWIPTPNDIFLRQALADTAEVEKILMQFDNANMGQLAAKADQAAHSWRKVPNDFGNHPSKDKLIELWLNFPAYTRFNREDADRPYYALVAIEDARRDLRRAKNQPAEDQLADRMLSIMYAILRQPPGSRRRRPRSFFSAQGCRIRRPIEDQTSGT